jgi:hypothetical protein
VIESEWERFAASSVDFRNQHEELKSAGILFMFKDIVPNRLQHIAFLREILEFVCTRQNGLSGEYVAFWNYEFPSTLPLMIQLLRIICLRRCGTGENGDWDSDITGGFVDRPAGTIARIVEQKSAKANDYKPASELWLVIQRSGRPSEMVLPIGGVAEFNESVELQKSLDASPFARVYVFTAMGLFGWQRTHNKWESLRRDVHLEERGEA